MAKGPLSVEQALTRVLDGLTPLGVETISLDVAHGRVLAEDLAAGMSQPPFPSSAMDGYAVRAADAADPGSVLTLTGESAAGHPCDRLVRSGEAVRIFTGGAVPDGANAILIQENARRAPDGSIQVIEPVKPGEHVRRKGYDFNEGDVLLRAGQRLSARDLLLAATMNEAALPVRRRPRVAILATGDELVSPGGTLGAGQIVSSIPHGLEALVNAAGGAARRIGIARDTKESLAEHLASAKEADILVTIGGASVGDHDIVQQALRDAGVAFDFWRIAMRPGKPLMYGRRGDQRVLGVPGNPVSAVVCSRVFLVPMLRALLGLRPMRDTLEQAVLDCDVEANGPRQHYMRATLTAGKPLRVNPSPTQDSSLVAVLARSDCLVIRPPNAPAARKGDTVPLLRLDF
ncbi:MAG: gephyrin-like molybdotransferase Glp [Pseudomonadota bacterium]|nr:gephyrin-like molybdotransferase Glp [Pseudomonadota bacterium]